MSEREGDGIPRAFHFIWFGEKVPVEYSNFMMSWMDLHPEWRCFAWGDADDWSWLRNLHIFNKADEIAPNHIGQLRADVARLEILSRYGGVYVDMDMEPRKSIEPLMESVDCFLGWEVQDRWANNAIIGSVPDHPFINTLIFKLPRSIQLHRGGGCRPNVMTGPQFITPVLNEFRGLDTAPTVYPQEYFYPYGYNELERRGEEFPEAYAIHHWNNKRRKLEYATA